MSDDENLAIQSGRHLGGLDLEGPCQEAHVLEAVRLEATGSGAMFPQDLGSMALAALHPPRLAQMISMLSN